MDKGSVCFGAHHIINEYLFYFQSQLLCYMIKYCTMNLKQTTTIV